MQDLRYAIRALIHSPGFTLVAVATVALAIGANTAIFSVVDAVLLRPLAYREPDRLVMVWESNRSQHETRNVASPADFLDWQAQNTVFEDMAALRAALVNLTGAGEPEELRGQAVTWNLLPMLGVNAALGRTFLREEEESGKRVVVLSHRLWERRFGGDRGIVGRAITLSGGSFRVIGVMPPGFHFQSRDSEFWIPFGLEKSRDWRKTAGRFILVAARLKPGVSVRQARAEMDAIAVRLQKAYPAFNSGWGVHVVPLAEDLTGDVQRALYVLLAAVGLVLLTACANVANLLLARASAREGEMAIRVSLGAGPWRLARQMLSESLLLGILGGALGLLLASWGLDLLLALAPRNLPRLDQVHLDARVLVFTLVLSVATGVLFGFAPAVFSARTSLAGSLKGQGRTATASRRGRRLSNGLVIVELALSLVLLVASGLLMRSFLRLMAVPPGFQPDHLLTARVLLTRYQTPQGIAFFQQAVRRMEALPGVRAASAVSYLPFGGEDAGTGVRIEGRPAANPGEEPGVSVLSVEPGYFRTMGISLVAGRDFEWRDTAQSPRVFLVDQAFARRYFPKENPLGRRVSVEMEDENPFGAIVGVVGSVKGESLEKEAEPTVYYPHPQLPYPFMTFVVRSAGDPAALASGMAAAVRSLDPNLPLAQVRVMDEVIDASIARRRFNMLLLAVFAGVALALAAVGIYGVMSYAVARRRHEIGVRMALGARRGDVLRMVLRQGSELALAGVALGLAGSWALTRAMGSLLFGVQPRDPLTFALVTLVLAGAAIAAAYLPARRATRVDPLAALRYE